LPSRAIAVAAFLAALAAIAVVLVGPGADRYEVRARFANAGQLVKGNSVQLAGTPVGSVQRIDLTRDGQAEVTLRISDEGLRPLPRGTRAVVRQASLSGVANRYVDLRLPDGAPRGTLRDGEVIEQADTQTAVELDQLFNTFDRRTREGLRNVLRGYGEAYAGRGAEANAGLAYLDPSLAAASRLFREINRDTPTLRRFVRANARLTGDLAERRAELAGLVRHLEATTGALARRRPELGRAIERLPAFMRRANTTFVDLRAALDDLAPLVEESKPAARELRPFLADLRPLARDARPALRDLAALIRRPGPANDLIELTRSIEPVRDIAVRDVRRNGARREGAFPASVRALSQATPELATLRPYAPDLTGWFDDFSHSGLYDALGAASRAAPHANLFAPVLGAAGQTVLRPLADVAAQNEAFAGATSLGQRWRCPGAAERKAAWKPSPDFPCDLAEQPLGR
jgi:phospholipid/cholesterol/gamma-HCH transport system substrate-binding protein